MAAPDSVARVIVDKVLGPQVKNVSAYVSRMLTTESKRQDDEGWPVPVEGQEVDAEGWPVPVKGQEVDAEGWPVRVDEQEVDDEGWPAREHDGSCEQVVDQSERTWSNIQDYWG